MEKVGDIESGQHDICPVTGLSVLRKPEWTDVGFGKDYRVTISIVGDNILRVQPSGYVTLDNQINVLKLTEQAPAEAIPGGEPYIHIEDWSNFQGASLAARKYYMDEMQARKRISGVIFCHVSYMFKMSVKLGKTLRMVKFPVHIVDDYSEAVRLALDIQSKENAQEDKSVIAPLIKKDAPINVFPADEESVCPSTSLPITTRPEWTDISIDDNYSVSFSLLGNAILRVVPNGIVTDAGTRRLIEEREKVLRDVGFKGKRYAEIRDHSMIASKPSKESRMMLTNLLLKETNEGSLLGFWIFNAPLLIRLMIEVGVRLHKPSAPVGAIKDYSEAAENAVNVLDQNGIDVGIRQYNRFTKDEWNLEFENFAVRFELIEDDIIYSVSHGSLKEAYVDKFFELHEKVLEETGLTAKGCFYRILDWENLQKTTWKARRMYIDGIKDLNRKVPCKNSVIFGLNKFMRTIISISKQLIPFPVTTAGNFEKAMAIIERKKGKEPETRIAKMKGRTEETPQDEKIRNYCDELLEFMGMINWDQEGTEWEAVGDSHPFKPVYDAMSIIKEDVDDIFRIKRQIKETLAREKEKYRDIFQNVSDFLYFHDFEGNFTETNLAWKKEVGMTEDDLSGLNLKDLLPERYKKQFDPYLNRIKANGKDEGLLPIKTKDGRERIIEFRNSLIHGATGPIGVRGSARDITKQIHAQEALRQSEEKYRTILENIEDGYFEVDLAGNLTFFNDALCRITGDPKDKLMGMNNREYMDEETGRKVYKTYMKIFETGEPVKGLEYAILKNGNKKHVETSVSLMKDKKGQPIGFRGILRDVSERKQAEEALRESEEKYRTILESIEDGYFEVDIAGNLTFFNDTMCRMLGYSKNELMGMNSREYMDKKNAKAAYRTFNKIYTTGQPAKGFDWELTTKERAKKIYVEANVSLMKDSKGQPTGFQGMLRDITSRKMKEDALRKSKADAEAMNIELEEVNKQFEQAIERANEMATEAEIASMAKSEFLANMSHEIRTPMNGVIGMTRILLDTELTPEQRHYAEATRSSADSLLMVINEILDYSKIEADKLELEVIDFDLRLTIEDMIDVLSITASQKGLELACEVHHEVPSRLRGDPGRLRQILINIAGNAIKFTEKGEVAIRIALEKEDEVSATVRFTVSDTGIGIPQDKMDFLFQSFSQVDTSTTRKYGGTGLGLAISKGLVELMDGEIDVESKEGKGTTFEFTIDLEKQTEDHDAETVVPADILHKRILVVDDNQTNREILRIQLQYWGCSVEEVSSGQEALEELHRAITDGKPFDIAVVDMQMPGMDGVDLGRIIKGDPALENTILIMLTSMGQYGDAAKAKEIGFAAYLSKPVKNSQFYDVLVTVSGLGAGQTDEGGGPIVTKHSAAETRKNNIRILLAEDNSINQEIALNILDKLGYRADAVPNGREVLKSLEKIPYNLVLMDIQMPEMDGFAATREIRNPQSAIRDHKIPVIAMTAHAMQSDRDACIEAGMDDYVSKPISPKKLSEAIERWTGNDEESDFLSDDEVGEDDAAPDNETDENPPIDLDSALERAMGNKDFLDKMINGFIKSMPEQIESLRGLIKQEDGDALRKGAHSLKGASANLSMSGLSAAAFRLEQMGRDGELSEADQALGELGRQFEVLEEFLALK